MNSIRAGGRLLAGGLMVVGVSVWGQGRPGAEPRAPQPPIEIRTIEGLGTRGKIKTPEYRTSFSSGRVAPRDWGYVVATFDTTPEWMDDVTFQFYVLLYKEIQGKKEYSLLKGTVSYMDVAKGRRHLAEVFMRPTTLMRWGDAIGVAVEVLTKGEVVGSASDTISGIPKNPNEWAKNPNVMVRDGLLLNRGQTPFALVNWDDYEVLK